MVITAGTMTYRSLGFVFLILENPSFGFHNATGRIVIHKLNSFFVFDSIDFCVYKGV